jgi:inner membrane protein
LNRKTAYATLAAVLAAEAADMDIFWGLRGQVDELKHHRGITHTFIAVPVVAGVVVGTVWLLHRWREGRRRPKLQAFTERNPGAPVPLRLQQQPVNWVWLYATALIAALSHLLLDWTNNYGVRPFFPFNPRWYAGSFMFIAEPVLWALFFLALAMPWLFGLADREMGVRRQVFRGRGWAIFALIGMVALWGWRWTEHERGVAMVGQTQVATAPVIRVGLEPYPVTPFKWHAILETDGYYQTAEINTRTGVIDSDAQTDVLFKPPVTEATEAAKRTPLGQAYLDWGTWAVVRDVGQVAEPGMDPPKLPPNRTWTTVEFTDLRFGYSYLGAGRTSGRNTLGGAVYIVDGHEDAGEEMNGREQK